MVTRNELEDYYKHRLDMSSCLIHWTREAWHFTTYQSENLDPHAGSQRVLIHPRGILKRILQERCVKKSDLGMSKGRAPVVCFSETPLWMMARLFKQADYNATTGQYSNPNVGKFLKYRPYGILFHKSTIYRDFYGRPVFYLSDKEVEQYLFDQSYENFPVPNEGRFLWRMVAHDKIGMDFPTDWSHEREWRTPYDVTFSELPADERPCVIVPGQDDKDYLEAEFPSPADRPMRDILLLSDCLA
jgi:hypothetical protein